MGGTYVDMPRPSLCLHTPHLGPPPISTLPPLGSGVAGIPLCHTNIGLHAGFLTSNQCCSSQQLLASEIDRCMESDDKVT